MATNCICYVVDDNYLFPTLVSASQARALTPPELADIVIVCIAPTPDRVNIAKGIAKKLGIDVLHFGRDAIQNMHPMYGRLFINQLLPDNYQRIVYVDGDTQIMASLAPLINVEIPEGRFLAVRDPAGMFAKLSPEWLKRVTTDRTNAGLLKSYDDYLNTGVLVFNRSDWTELADATLKAIAEKDGGFKFGDQDPMNLAVGDRCLYLSNTWNFPGFLIGTKAETASKPAIYHFMSNPRPWLHSGLPWGAKWQQPYRRFAERFPEIAPLVPKATIVDQLKYHLQQSLKLLTEYMPVSVIKETNADLHI